MKPTTSEYINNKIESLNKKDANQLKRDLHHVYGMLHGLEMFFDNNRELLLCNTEFLKPIMIFRQNLQILKDKIIEKIHERMKHVMA